MSLTAQAFTAAAAALGCDVASIRAVDEVESAGAGFDASGRVKILFEPHIFHRLTEGRHAELHPQLSYRTWVPGAPSYRRDQHVVLAEAKALDASAAVQSCSWGRYQVMGFHWRACGFRAVEHFETAMRRGEGEHLASFVAFIRATPAALAGLRAKDWPAFARAYNGSGYAKNKYDTKLAAAYARHSKGA